MISKDLMQTKHLLPPHNHAQGVFVFQPSRDTFNALVQMQTTEGSFDGKISPLLSLLTLSGIGSVEMMSKTY